MVNYGAVYPQAILIFVITLTYSVVFPPILIFGAIYFGVAYLVYKYKLLFGVSINILCMLTSGADERFQCFISPMNHEERPGHSHLHD